MRSQFRQTFNEVIKKWSVEIIKEMSVFFLPLFLLKLWGSIWLSGFTEFIVFMILAFFLFGISSWRIYVSVFLAEFVHVLMSSSGSKPNSFSFVQLFVIQRDGQWMWLRIESRNIHFQWIWSISSHSCPSRQHPSREIGVAKRV